jgi:CheY-like chemotaxis protein
VKLSTLRVLLVEDTVSQQKLMGKWLNGQGCEVTFAINGKIGLELLKTRQFDICLMDFLMVGSFPLLSFPVLSFPFLSSCGYLLP